MEKVYEYMLQFANEMELSDRIEPNNSWHIIQIPLKSLKSAQTVLNCFQDNSIKFTRFWKIVRCEKGTYHEEIIQRSTKLILYEEAVAIKHENYVKSRHAKVEEINKLDKEFIIEEDFHDYKVFIERSEAIYKPDMRGDIQCSLAIKFVSHINNSELDFYLWNYISDNKKLLKKKFFENFISIGGDYGGRGNGRFIGATKIESDTLLEIINNTFNALNKIIKS